ncbi:MAG: type III-B CRISPR-associated protein Cas10/Cmr2 [bacterium]|nr:type III-B CRISPR-associated protein Cas10/Cmr2 [bacterium]
MKHYIAITLGPITRVISMAKSTKELWAASYLFSYLAKQLIRPFKERNFLLPYLDPKMDQPEVTLGAGVYPDRYIFEAQEGDFELLCKRVDQVLVDLAIDITAKLSLKVDMSKVEAYLRHTLKIYFCELAFDDSQVDQVVSLCEQRLATLECQDCYPLKEQKQEDYLPQYFSRVNASFLVKDGFGSDKKGRLFETVLECSSGGKTTEETTQLLPYEKYIAIAKADGDNLTATIKQLKAKGKDIQALSKALFEFSIQAIACIKDFGGMAVFVGGDDLLFFAPVRRGDQTVFDLIRALDTAFKRCLNEALQGEAPSTLSFGVSMTYHKFPLFEAVEQSEGLLSKAKRAPGKNHLAWCLRKHSGQIVQGLMPKANDRLYRQFGNLLAIAKDEQQKEDFFRSFTYWLSANSTHLAYLLSKPAESAARMLINCFRNNFNEDVHVGKAAFEQQLVDYLLAAAKASEKPEQAIDELVAVLRFVGFLISK